MALATAAFSSCVQNNGQQQTPQNESADNNSQQQQAKNDSGDNSSKQQTPKKVRLQYEYSMFCAGDILEFADIEITHTDGNGKFVTETITAEQLEDSSIAHWHANISINTIPARLFVSARYLPKSGIKIDKDKLISTKITLSGSSVNYDQIYYKDVQMIETPVESVRASKLKAYFDLINENPPTLDYTLQESSNEHRWQAYELVKNN